MKNIIIDLMVIILAIFMALPSQSEIVPIPQGAPLELENYQPDLPANGTTGPVIVITTAIVACCIIFYIYKEEGDYNQPHFYTLMRDSYNDQWEMVGWIETAVTARKARALMADHIESGSGYRYRVLDWGPVNQ